MSVALSVTHLLLGTGVAYLSTRFRNAAAALEWVGGIALIIGLSAFGSELARY